MYERTIVPNGGESPTREAVFDADGLRLLSWNELIARLGAARDFRRIMSGRYVPGGGSFNLASARHLAARGEVKPGINPFALTNGKIADGMASTVTSDDMSGDRGKE